jgi:hydroxyethylthiazole kinase-like uncharacterized protein yjeF
MTDLLTAAQMRAIEGAAIEAGAATGRDLMERAGRALVAAVVAQWPVLGRGPHRALVLCGPGNNGGDGFVVARLLADRGWTVEILLCGAAEHLPPDARANHDQWGGAVGDLATPGALAGRAAPDLVVDALFGTGLTRPLEGPLAQVVAETARLRAQGARVVAVDLPSGLCSDSGRPLGACITADLSVAFHRAKPGHYLAEGPAHCGRLAVVPIGLDEAAPVLADRVILTGPAPGLAAKAGAGHKYAHGHALLLSGGPGQTGAARLAARAALRIGAGLVTLGVPPAAQQEAAAQLTAVMLTRLGDAAALREALADNRVTALCLGPALGLAEDRRPLIEAALRSGRAAVLDADAIGHFAAAPTLFAQLHDRCVLTPHGGEFARLFPDLAEKLDGVPDAGPAFSRVDAARAAAARAGCTVLLKGPDTVIASPDGPCAVNASTRDRAAPWLATAGSGDVLAGIITGLLARGFDPQRAAETGAWLHTECALSVGPGLIAEDLPEQLPEVLRRL